MLKPLSTKVLKYGSVVCINPAEGGGAGVIRFGDDLSRWSPDEGLGIGVRSSYSMLDVVREVTWRTGKHPLDVLVASTLINASLIGFDNLGAIDVGSRANIVMFNMSEPPGWPIPSNINSIVKAVVEGDLRVESLIVNDDIVVDAGETLNVGADLIKKAVGRLEPVIKKYYALGKN
ncbi:MAG: amidohydrolase family protein [Desulfurococcales archaeon]|nr:amidohydrolase family protein [Desulfurococcales archaeon]